jgi:hypothetical protein
MSQVPHTPRLDRVRRQGHPRSRDSCNAVPGRGTARHKCVKAIVTPTGLVNIFHPRIRIRRTIPESGTLYFPCIRYQIIYRCVANLSPLMEPEFSRIPSLASVDPNEKRLYQLLLKSRIYFVRIHNQSPTLYSSTIWLAKWWLCSESLRRSRR